MSDINAKRQRLLDIQEETTTLNRRLHVLHEEQQLLEWDITRHGHPCDCVKLNSELDIQDMVQQSAARRSPLTMGGWVGDTLTASSDCPKCKGTGKPIGQTIVTEQCA